MWENIAKYAISAIVSFNRPLPKFMDRTGKNKDLRHSNRMTAALQHCSTVN
jgi:hypothetical protein